MSDDNNDKPKTIHEELAAVPHAELWAEVADCHHAHHCGEMFTRVELVNMIKAKRAGDLTPLPPVVEVTAEPREMFVPMTAKEALAEIERRRALAETEFERRRLRRG